MRKNHTTYEIVWAETGGPIITIHDLNRGKSVTNNAEAVVLQLHRAGMLTFANKPRKLMYYDSMGNLDQIEHDGDGGFLRFVPTTWRAQP